MRTLLVALALGCVCLFFNTSTSVAASPQNGGHISSQMLTDMGLNGMQQMTDAQGMEIRGKGALIGNLNAVIFLGNLNYNNINITQVIITKSSCCKCGRSR